MFIIFFAMVKKTIYYIIFSSIFLLGNNYNATAYGQCNCSEGYADLVEPLLPSVVNISASGTKEVMLSPLEQMFGFGMLMPFGSLDGLDMGGQLVRKKTSTLGSGFIISQDGYIVTNYHIANNADNIVIITNDKKEYKAEIIGMDKSTDIALLKVKTKNDFPYLKFGSSSKSRIGDVVVAIGNPFGLGNTVTSGIISAKSRHLADSSNDFIQTDAAINQGNSGGPMFNLRGEVIGINTAIISTGNGGGNVGIGFAVPSDTVTEVIEKLKKDKKIIRPWIGIAYAPVTSEIAENVGLKEVYGAFIHEVRPNSPASKSGMKEGDILIKFGDKKVDSDTFLPGIVSSMSVGSIVDAEVWRYGKVVPLKLKLEQNNEDSNDSGDLKRTKKSILGISVKEIGKELKKSLKIPNEVSGVIITELNGYIAESGRLKKGDLIYQINNTPVRTVSEFKKIAESIEKSNKKGAIFYIYRNGNKIVSSVQFSE